MPRLLAVVALARLALPAPLAAQESADRLQDRVIPDDCFCEVGLDTPSVSRAVGQIADATKVPLGFEYLPTTTVQRYDENQRRQWLTGMTVGEALDVIVQLDPRYAWSETQGAIVVRPLLAWNDEEHFLERNVGPFSVEEKVDVTEMLLAIRRFMGQRIHAGPPMQPFDDTKISLSLPSASLIDVLNAVVAAHGELIWSIRYCWPSYWAEQRGGVPCRGPGPFPFPAFQPGNPHQVWFGLSFSKSVSSYQRRLTSATIKVPNPAHLPDALLEAPYLPGR